MSPGQYLLLTADWSPVKATPELWAALTVTVSGLLTGVAIYQAGKWLLRRWKARK